MTPRTITALVIPTGNEDPYLTAITPSWETFRDLLGGYLQIVPLVHDPAALMFVNEEGKNLGLPVNHIANNLVALSGTRLQHGDVIVGTAVVVSCINPTTGVDDGEEYDVPQSVLDLLRPYPLTLRIEWTR